MINLYKKDKYKVLVGKNESIGFCSAWNEPKRIFDKIKDEVGLVGTLYSKYGINIIFRNLALNPQITTLYIWANGPLSNTQVGKGGFTTLKRIWEENNVDIEGFEIEKEISKKVVEKIIKNVELKDVSNLQADKVIKVLSKKHCKSKPYMKPIKFKEPKQGNFTTYPSEDAGWLVRGIKISDTWAKLVDRIMRYGCITGTQYGYRQKQLVGASWVVQNESTDNIDFSYLKDLPNNLKEVIVADIHSLEQYNKEVFEKTGLDPNLAYTYGNRLQRYPTSKGEIDQVTQVFIKNLTDSLNSRRACAITVIPEIDHNSKEPPCLNMVQMLYNDNKLHLLATFRSHDIFKAGLSNAYGLLKLQEKVCTKLGVQKGSLQINSQSAHIYEQDWKDALDLCKCFFWEREPSMFWDHTINSDPRGNFLINLVNGQIEVTMQSQQGHSLLTIKGKSAKYLSLKLSQLDVIGKVEHAMDIARQLQRAEIALKKGIEFNQDQPLKL